jgi:hypothetical protein
MDQVSGCELIMLRIAKVVKKKMQNSTDKSEVRTHAPKRDQILLGIPKSGALDHSAILPCSVGAQELYIIEESGGG